MGQAVTKEQLVHSQAGLLQEFRRIIAALGEKQSIWQRHEYAEIQQQTAYYKAIIMHLETLLRRVKTPSHYAEIAHRFRGKVAPVDDFVIRVAVVGLVSSGKSSFLNALAGRNVAKTGLDATTTTIASAFQTPLRIGDRQFTTEFVDCPGFDSRNSPYSDEFLAMAAKTHVLVVLYNGTIDYMVGMLRVMAAMGKPIIFARSMCDMATKADVEAVIQRDVAKFTMLLPELAPRVFGISCTSSEKHDWLAASFASLRDAIVVQAEAVAVASGQVPRAPLMDAAESDNSDGDMPSMADDRRDNVDDMPPLVDDDKDDDMPPLVDDDDDVPEDSTSGNGDGDLRADNAAAPDDETAADMGGDTTAMDNQGCVTKPVDDDVMDFYVVRSADASSPIPHSSSSAARAVTQ